MFIDKKINYIYNITIIYKYCDKKENHMENQKKKNNKFIRFLLIIILLLLICLLIYFSKKLLIINKIKSEMLSRKENPISAYSIEYYNEDGLINGKKFRTLNYSDMQIIEYDINSFILTKDAVYRILKPEKIYSKIDSENNYISSKEAYYDLVNVFPDYSLDDSIFTLAKNIKIKTTEFNGTKCYAISHKNKETNSIKTIYLNKDSLDIIGQNDYSLKDKKNSETIITFKEIENKSPAIDSFINGYSEVDYETFEAKYNEVIDKIYN